MWFMIRVLFLEVLNHDIRFVERFIRGTVSLRAGEGGDQASGVKFEERRGFVIWVYFDILVGDVLFF